MKKIKKGDTVKIIAGKQKGVTGIVQKSIDDMVIVEGVNVMKRATKGKGFVEKTHPINTSNVAYYDTESSQTSKIRIVVNSDGKKVRQVVKTGRNLVK